MHDAWTTATSASMGRGESAVTARSQFGALAPHWYWPPTLRDGWPHLRGSVVRHAERRRRHARRTRLRAAASPRAGRMLGVRDQVAAASTGRDQPDRLGRSVGKDEQIQRPHRRRPRAPANLLGNACWPATVTGASARRAALGHADRCAQPAHRRAERDPGARPDEPRDRRRRRSGSLLPRGRRVPSRYPAAAWSSSPASSPPGASTSATTSARSSSTSKARTAATRRSTASSTCTRRPSTTTRRSCASARRTRRRCCVAAGLDPERCVLFRQGDVPEHTELTWLLSSVTPLGALNRMHQFRDKSRRAARAGRPPGCCSTPS